MRAHLSLTGSSFCWLNICFNKPFFLSLKYITDRPCSIKNEDQLKQQIVSRFHFLLTNKCYCNKEIFCCKKLFPLSVLSLFPGRKKFSPLSWGKIQNFYSPLPKKMPIFSLKYNLPFLDPFVVTLERMVI